MPKYLAPAPPLLTFVSILNTPPCINNPASNNGFTLESSSNDSLVLLISCLSFVKSANPTLSATEKN